MFGVIDMTMVIVALIGAVGIVVAALIPLMVSVRRSMARDVGKANGEGSLIEMTQRNSEQIGVLRAEQIEVKSELAKVRSHDLAEFRTVLGAHLEDHKHGKVWELVVKEKRPEDST
jgi:hypothetical protein